MLPPLSSDISPDSANDVSLNSLESLGTFFTSQIHDLNNQIAVLSNSELLIPQEPLSPAMTEFLDGLFQAIHRLSNTCGQFNVARKIFPVPVETMELQNLLDSIFDVVSSVEGWGVQAPSMTECRVMVNAPWLQIVIGQLISQMQVKEGEVHISIGELPPRQYRHSLRSSYSAGPAKALLIHFKGKNPAPVEKSEKEMMSFQIALELVRLMGAGLSLSRSDSDEDCLLALRTGPG